MDLIEGIEAGYVFRGLSAQDVDAMARLATVRRYEGGDVLIRQFDRRQDFMLVLQGAVKVRLFNEQDVAELQAGSVVGEVALVDEEPRSATVVSVGPSIVAVFPAAAVRELMARRPQVRATLMRNLSLVLAKRLRALNAQRNGALEELVLGESAVELM